MWVLCGKLYWRKTGEKLEDWDWTDSVSYTHLYIHHENQKASANEMFRQVGLLIETNEKDMEEVKNDFSERCIRAADMAAYFVRYNPEVKDSLERTRELAKKLDVDELHYFSREGKICGGTHPEYYGLSFDSGEQMSFFLPMLQDPSLKLCQDLSLIHI